MAVWKMKSPTDIILRMSLEGHERSVLAVDLSKTTITSGSEDKTIKVQSLLLKLHTAGKTAINVL